MLFNYKKNTLSILLSLAVSNGAQAFGFNSDADRMAEIQELFSKASNGKVIIEKTFPGPGELTGVVMQNKGNKAIAWVTADNKIMVGLLMDETGMNLSEDARKKNIGEVEMPATSAAPTVTAPALPDAQQNNQNLHETALPQGEALMEALKGLRAVPLGNSRATKELYVFGDLNCHYCESLYTQLSKENLKAQGVKVNWIPVAVLGEKSLTQAAQLLQSSNPVELLEQHHKNHLAISPVTEATPELPVTLESIKEATTLLLKFSKGTPAIAYWNGKDVITMSGLPQIGELKKVLKSAQAF